MVETQREMLAFDATTGTVQRLRAELDAAERVVDAALQAAAPAFAHRKRAETDGAAAIAYEAMAYRALDAILATLDAARGKP